MNESAQFRATGLRETLRIQGRKARWVAARVGVHESLLSHAMSGGRTVNAVTATQISDILGVPFFVLWELSNGDKEASLNEGQEAA
jgi:hypothetical protein